MARITRPPFSKSYHYSALTIALCTTWLSCRTPSGSQLLDAPVPADLLTKVDDQVGAKGHPLDPLTAQDRRPHLFPGSCGYDTSTVKPFKATANSLFFDETSGVWRRYARPTKNGCDSSEQ